MVQMPRARYGARSEFNIRTTPGTVNNQYTAISTYDSS
jgi:hypothetical protein